MMKYYLKLYKVVAGKYVEDLATQVYVVSDNIRKSAEPKNNTAKLVLNNPIINFFPNGKPRRLFVDAYGESVFKAAQQETGFDSFEEKVEIYAKDVDEIDEDIVTEDNLLFAGQIKDVKYTHEKKKCNVELTLSDRTFNIMNRIWSNDYESQTALEIVQNVIRSVVEDNTSFNRGGFNESGVTGQLDSHLLIDARLFTEGVKTGSESVTGFSAKTLTCSAATFITDGVSAGDMIKNETNYKQCLVKEVVSETQLIVSKEIFTIGDSIKISDGFMQDWRPDGSAFPDITFGESRKPAIEWISKLSQIEMLNTTTELDGVTIVKRPMKYYIDGKNRFHMFYPDDTPSVEIEMGATQPVGADLNSYKTYKCSMTKGIFDVINYIIFNAGEDMNGNSYTGYAQDPSSGGPNVKDSYRPMVKISEAMKLQAYVAGEISYSNGAYAYPSSYPLTPVWSNTGTSVANDAEYNAQFRLEGRRRGRNYALSIINQTANPRWKGTCEIGFFNMNPSDLIRFTDLDIGMNNVLLRIKEVQHNHTNKGFFTTLTLEEDLPEQG